MSNETKWTPGHWQAFIPIDGDRWTIASHRGPLVADCGIGENKYSGANAHLLAQAKALYEALDMLMDASGPGDAEQILAEERENIMALLAKARGETS